jgi:LEA14-like dessication related protein
MRVTRLTVFDTRMAFTLSVHNPNAYDLPVTALEATLAVESDRLLNGSLSAPVNLVAGVDTPVEIEARTDYLAILAAIDRVTRQRTVRYEVNGSATLRDGVQLPFTRRGELPLADLQGFKR